MMGWWALYFYLCGAGLWAYLSHTDEEFMRQQGWLGVGIFSAIWWIWVPVMAVCAICARWTQMREYTEEDLDQSTDKDDRWIG